MENRPKQAKHRHPQDSEAHSSNRDSSLPSPNALAIVSVNNVLATNGTTNVAVAKEIIKDRPDPRFECSICLNWLTDPTLTSCGHRYCRECIIAWLSQHNQRCPLDNKIISVTTDIFPDNYTRREIEELRYKCPNSPLGCSVTISPGEVEQHLESCAYREGEVDREKCPFANVRCDFIGRAQTNAVEEHLKADMPHHLQLVLQALQDIKKLQRQLTPAHQFISKSDRKLFESMFVRVVKLEQETVELESKVLQVKQNFHNFANNVKPRFSNGVIVWNIENYQNVIDLLTRERESQIYSKAAYTSPHGYKFCARINLSPGNLDKLSLHVHFMRSENDFHLDWPFKGRIRFILVHPRDSNLSQRDTIMTKPDYVAFHRPLDDLNQRGFGFIDYVSLNDICNKGFTEGDRIVIKVHIDIV